MPVSVHVNYHPEKLPRMEDIFERYHGLGHGEDLGNGEVRGSRQADRIQTAALCPPPSLQSRGPVDAARRVYPHRDVGARPDPLTWTWTWI